MLLALCVSLGLAAPIEPHDTVGNHLLGETSGYLRAHADNPVDWYPWGDEAFEQAKKRDVPILLSIGFSGCTYCWQMEKESFLDPAVAAYVNEHFVAVKVDRDERPAVDAIYSAALKQLTGKYGWPATLFLTPDGHPFDGGTYFPPVARDRKPAFKDRVAGVVQAWDGDRDDLVLKAKRIRQALVDQAQRGSALSVPSADVLDEAMVNLLVAEDREYGGWGVTKLPRGPTLQFLVHRAAGGHDDAKNLLNRTLHAMAQGQVHDHVRGGFHHRSDPDWRVSQGDKRVADNALLAQVYLDTWVLTGETPHRKTAEGILAWLSRGSGRSIGDNGLLISALARGSVRLDDAGLAGVAREVATAVLSDRQDGALPHIRRGTAPGVLDDYAFVAQGLLDLYEVDADPAWLQASLEVARSMHARFAVRRGGFRYAAEEDVRLAEQLRWNEDSAPSGLAVAVSVTQRLVALGADLDGDVVSRSLGRADRYLSGREAGLSLPTLLRALDTHHRGLRTVVIVGTDDVGPLMRAYHAAPRPGAQLAVARPDALPSRFAIFEGKLADGARAWVCRGDVCEAPTGDPEALRRSLESP